MKPMPPCTCTPVEATSTPMSVHQALAIGHEQVLAPAPALARVRILGVPGEVAGDRRGQADAARRPRSGPWTPPACGARPDGRRSAAEASPVKAERPWRRSRAIVEAPGSRRAWAMETPSHPHRQARGVHHGEHVRQALVRPADQLGARALEGHDAGGRGVDAELVLEPGRPDLVARAERPVGVDQVFGGQEQRDAACCPRARRAGGPAPDRRCCPSGRGRPR